MSNLPFLLLILLFVAIAPAVDLIPTLFTPVESLFWGLFAYLLTLALIAVRCYCYKFSWPRHNPHPQKFVNIALIFFVFLFCFVLKSNIIFENSATISTLLPLSLYFCGLAFFYALVPPRKSTIRSELFFLIPFVLPLLCLNIFTDGSTLFDLGLSSENYWSPSSLITTLVLLILFFGGLMLFMPYVIQAFWLCEPLHGPLRNRLEALCEKANFRYRDLKTWGVMDHVLTAAVLGIYWKFRYVLFTKRLIAEMSPDSVEAILGHEIGHNKHKHLIVYPFIIAGMILLITLLTLFFELAVPTLLTKFSIHLSDFEWQLYTPLWILFCYIGMPLLYLRYLFGFFSRLFERQADLYIFALGIAPPAMIEALEHIGAITGSLRKPNWHHYSLQERIDFLKAAEADRSLISKHHQFTHRMLFIYAGCFVVLLGFLFYQSLSIIS